MLKHITAEPYRTMQNTYDIHDFCHDQDPKDQPRPSGTLLARCNLVLLLGYQAVTRGKNKLPHTQYTLDPQYFYRF